MIKSCNFCGGNFDKFLPLKNHITSEFLEKVNGVGSDVKNYQCPLCGVNDRERHLKMYLENSGVLSRFNNSSILHFSPERGLLNLIQSQRPKLHILAQFGSADPRFQPIDIERIPYSNESFDFVIANHLLEHVSSPETALEEINRILKPDGLAILQTPFSNLLEKTFEDPAINSEHQREYFFGQADHLRLFGRDLFTLLDKKLSSRLVQHSDLFPEHIAVKYGVNMNEPFFLFGRKVRKESMTSLCPELKQGRRNDRPKVSVIVVTYNHQDYLKEALDSILEQDCSFGYEVIVADDCSTDETLQVAQEYRNRNPNRIRILESAENNGPFRNGRRAFPLARGEYIALLDGDDFWLDSRKLEKQSSYLDRNPQCVMTYASIQASMNGKIDFDYIGGFRRDLTSDELILTAPLNTSTVMFRKVFSTLPNLGSGFTPDLLLWSLLGRYGSGHYHEDILPTHYRIHDRGYHGSRSLSNRIAMRLQTFVYLVNFYSTAGNGELTKAFIGKVVLDMVQLRKLLETESEEAVFETIKAAAKSVFAPSDDFIDLLQLIWKQTRISSSLVGVEAESRLTELETLAAARN